MVLSIAIPIFNKFSVAAWNSSIRQAVNHIDYQKALLLFRQLKLHSNEPPNNFTFPFIAKACAKLSNLKFSQIIHAHVVKSPFSSDIYVQTALFNAYAKCNHLECAHQLFDEMPVRDIASWNAIIVGFSQVGSFDRVSLLLNRMRIDNIVPDALTVIGLTQLVSAMKNGILLSSVHCFGLKYGFGEYISVSNTWISGYAKCGDFFSAEIVFSGIDLDYLSVVSWNAMISGCAYFQESDKALGVYRQMLCDGYRPDLSTILNLLSSFAETKFLYHGMLIHAHGIKFGCDADITLLNTLISMYSKCGDINSARYIFDCMTERSCVTWTVMIGGYSEKGDLDEALSLFRNMEFYGENPDLVTVIHLISACGKVGALEIGKWIDDYTISNGLKKNLMVRNAFMDMYAKCGSMGDALDLFHTMSEKDVVSWTTLISGLALNGESREALDYFNQMLRLGLKPNHITFLAILQACTHAGFLEKGREIYNMMTREYHIRPGLDHYACMTDLLGRLGKLDEALGFIKEMPIKPDAGVWGALLSSCKIHRNLEIGEYAANHLFRLEPEAAAPYVEMANIYAAAKDWKGVAAMRAKMKREKVAKSPGQSVVQVDGKCWSLVV
ncbi:pentatricopeptide repeat-containing protein at4g19191 mitochondrial [Phtheirospermum japonicum]|uniref:Pentatricopeptide repeat-containing protein at4g19191 mitochondrial n=1 Tax=Phtheirospermum japonicum TaxID=374723 RepID=A0A830D8E5_9LAMI|nr:pentatricopeptide repeat-containing protein at4g19191 mitochondrial [Phtheirospermum japonicum]